MGDGCIRHQYVQTTGASMTCDGYNVIQTLDSNVAQHCVVMTLPAAHAIGNNIIQPVDALRLVNLLLDPGFLPTASNYWTNGASFGRYPGSKPFAENCCNGRTPAFLFVRSDRVSSLSDR